MKSDPLFNLIKSLRRAEKSNFKKDAVAFGGKNAKYLQLFDAMDKQESFDKERLHKKLNDEKLSRNFSMSKTYLYEALLKSLHTHRKTHGYNSLLITQINHAEVLFSKGLFNDSASMAKKAKELAYKTNSFHSILVLIGIQQKIYQRFPLNKSIEDFKKLTVEKQEIYDILSNSLVFENFFNEMMNLAVNRLEGNKTSQHALETWYSNFVLKNDVRPMSNLARMLSLTALSFYYNLTDNIGQSMASLKEMRNLLESNMHFAKRNDSQNLIYVYNAIGRRSIELEDYKLTMECLNKLDAQKPEYKALVDSRDSDYLVLSMQYVISTKDFDFFDKLKVKFPKTFSAELNYFLQKEGYYICYRLAHIYSLRKEYEHSLTYISILMQEEFKDKAKGIASDILLVYCLNHMALDNAYLVSNNLKTVKRSLESPGEDLEHKEVALELLTAYSKSPLQKQELLEEYSRKAERLIFEVGKPTYFIRLGHWLEELPS